MKKLNNKALIIFLWGLIFFSCWENQKHNVTAPDTPVYALSGKIISSLTNEPIPYVNVRLSGSVKYNKDDKMTNFNLEDVTDENGVFTFNDVPGGFEYVLYSEKEGYSNNEKKIVTYYSDRDIGEVVLEKLIILLDKACFQGRKINGIAYKAGIILIADTLNKKMVELSEDLSFQRAVNFNLYKPSGLAYDGEWFWTSDSFEAIVFNFQYDEMGRVIYQESYPAPKNFYNPDDVVDLLDISWFNSEIWACTEQITTKYFRLNLDEAGTAEYFDSPVYHPSGIYVDSSKVYIASMYGGKSKLYVIDKETAITAGYYVFSGNAGFITSDGNYLWVANEDSVKKYLFN